VRTDRDAATVLADGFRRIREEHHLPDGFPPEVEAAAEEASHRPLPEDRDDARGLPLVTLDPAGSTDLDQAMALSADGDTIVLSYAIADVGAFVAPGDVVDDEAWRRGVTVYAPDGPARLYPPALSEHAASLLPDGDRPAVLLTVAVDGRGQATLRSARRALVRSRAQLAYGPGPVAGLPPLLPELARRIETADEARGAWRLDAPEQEIVSDPTAPSGVGLRLRPRDRSEDENAAASLAANLAVAATMDIARCGLFRTMPEPNDRHLAALRRTAVAMGVVWPEEQSLRTFARSLDQRDPSQAAFLFAARRAGPGAGYTTWSADPRPWHAALAACYAHATAPLRRLADRSVLDVVLALTSGQDPDAKLRDRLERLPEVMDRAEDRAAAVERAAIDLVEAVILADRIGDELPAVVTDADRAGARVQLVDPVVRTKVDLAGAEPGERLVLRVRTADPGARRVELDVVRRGHPGPDGQAGSRR
jgi:exoribonuclease R